MAVTIKDIAKKAGVSYSTVSRALNNDKIIKQETRERIARIAREMGYKPNAIARGLVMKETNTLGLVIPDITNPFYPEVARGIEECANEYGYTIFLCNSNWDSVKENKYIDILQSKRVDGIIVAPVSQELDIIRKTYAASMPVVFVGKKIEFSNSSYVVIDNRKGGFIATEYLLNKGYTRIAFIGGLEKDSTNHDRLMGYQDALKINNIPVDPSIIKQGSFKRESGYDSMISLLEQGNEIQAVFAGNDVIAFGVMQAIRAKGLRIPEDIAVVGFDNIPISGYPEISLTTVDQDKYKIGRLAAEMAINYIKNSEDTWESKAVVLEPKLVVRNSA
jgi:LacI family transcriptional regulator